jgi:hypothetical protein
MNQNTARTLMYAGIFAFLVTLGTEMSHADGWMQLASTKFVGHMIGEIGAMGVAVFGALKVKPA